MACTICKLPYPDALLKEFETGRLGADEPAARAKVCGICALALSNAVMTHKRTRFDGPAAEELRQQAIRWRRSHGYDE